MHPCYRSALQWMHYTTSYKHSLLLPGVGEIIARNMLSWLGLLINRYCCIGLVIYITNWNLDTLGHSLSFGAHTYSGTADDGDDGHLALPLLKFRFLTVLFSLFVNLRSYGFGQRICFPFRSFFWNCFLLLLLFSLLYRIVFLEELALSLSPPSPSLSIVFYF